jgi:cob(I)alamin adenosyltransferase
MSDSKGTKGLVMIYTGNGKGKTTAALGQLVRVSGWDWKVVMFQFIKGSKLAAGEHRAAKKLGLDLRPMGAGFTWNEKGKEKAVALSLEQWRNCKDAILSGDFKMVIMDEASYPMKLGWISLKDVIDTIKRRPEGTHVLLTGRDMPDEIIELADLVTEMREIKHPFNNGIKAQKGVEF